MNQNQKPIGKKIKITSFYKWYRNPIKWWKDRKPIKFMNLMANHWYENGGEEEICKMQAEVLMYGTAVMKDGTRINYKDFFTTQ